MPAIYLLATLDTKGPEAAWVAACLRDAGAEVKIVDCGCLGEPSIVPDVSRETIYSAGGESLDARQAEADRGKAIEAAARGAAAFVHAAWQRGELSGVLGLGGSAGSTVASRAMQSLPLGVPKLLVSTLASGNVRPYVADKDITMMNSVVDIAGVNRISRVILRNAALAMAGMTGSAANDAAMTTSPANDRSPAEDRPLIAATMFGVTTPCVEAARKVLESAGYEVLVFHATGNGGQAMESLIADGLITGVLDITTTEIADELVGGVLSAGPRRLEAAAAAGIPQVVSVGATDMVNFGTRDSVPDNFADRKFYEHNATITLMRTTVDENTAIGDFIANKLASAPSATIMLPLRGVSAIDAAGQPFEDSEAREALFAAIRQGHGQSTLKELPLHINDSEFATAAAENLLEQIANNAPNTTKPSS